jgi:hypothetical protein
VSRDGRSTPSGREYYNANVFLKYTNLSIVKENKENIRYKNIIFIGILY